MNIFLYIIIFITGAVFGSFYTLAIYRIPKRQDITHTHSYCPNCNHKLGFLDLIPILSYVFLRGKCRYCGEKIRPRYLIIEILSGVTFVAIAFLTKVNIETISIVKLIEFGFLALYITFIFLTAGIDKENLRIDKYVSAFGIVISIMYMIYLYIVEQTNIYRYIIYLIFYIIVLILDTITLKRYAKDSYVTGILNMIITMVIFTGEYVTENAIIFTLLIIFFYLLFQSLRQKKRRNQLKKIKFSKKLSIGFYLGVSNILMLIFVLYFINYR